VTASGGRPLEWDNLRVPGVNGRDRQVIPDGRLCSAGLDRFKGLDLPRADWPTTALPAGAARTFGYRTTIPHRGTFRLYLTRPGYTPTAPLRWADLDTEPFLTATDPAVRGGAYVLTGRLPAGRTGRHLIYTVWRNSSTPDTYYSCSDVVLTGSSAPASGEPSTDTSAGPSNAAPGAPASSAASDAAATSTVPLTRTSGTRGVLPFAAGGLALFVAAAVVGLALRRRRLLRTDPGGRWAS
jgi:chitin-binding protein